MADRIRAASRDSSLRQQKIRELYEVRDRRYREIDKRAEAYLKGYREKFLLPDLPGLSWRNARRNWFRRIIS